MTNKKNKKSGKLKDLRKFDKSHMAKGLGESITKATALLGLSHTVGSNLGSS